ncbi:MAG: hypothetical protein KME07_23240 [Pegethrix bostrychoides GSE-TBD4-15B]|uniref:Uncharacterized protein n=1 Tax=Pegethrix bostrychoides GSE-TBD4-15B TaxID=2839662 RepID=A0A951PFF6_9CYAN|nr:hypothetical protein [Pegethrix bostrychoides GSE-TBD4-15B]
MGRANLGQEEPGQAATILNYYFALQHEAKKPLNEAKVLLVGQGSVGKTSRTGDCIRTYALTRVQKYGEFR